MDGLSSRFQQLIKETGEKFAEAAQKRSSGGAKPGSPAICPYTDGMMRNAIEAGTKLTKL